MKRTFIKMLPIVAAIVLATSCSKDGNDGSNVAIDPVESQNVASPTESNTIPFTITVGKDAETLSKATLQDGTTTTQVFEPGDQLVLKNGETEVATLSLPADYTSSATATFTGDLNTEGMTSGTTEISVTLTNSTNGNIGTALTEVQSATSLSEAFQKYGYWTSSFTYKEDETPTITLTQNTAFVKVDLPFHGAKVTFTIGETPTVKYLDGNEIFAIPNGTKIASTLLSINKTVEVTEKKVVLNIKNRTTPTDCIAGVFSVAADKQIFFSKGNLQATTSDNGKNWSWNFATNQYDYIGDAAANNKVNGNGTVSENGTVDLFGWVGVSNTTWTGAAMYGISSSTTTNSNETYGTVASESLKSDWGKVFGESTPWSTLSKDEWSYLFNSRGEHSYVKAKVCEKNGVILLPDGWNTSTYSLSEYNDGTKDYNTNTINEENWTTLQSAGAVFLPAAGYRDGSSVDDAGSRGDYWSSSAINKDRAFDLFFHSGGLYPSDFNYRCYGFSVRLVRSL